MKRRTPLEPVAMPALPPQVAPGATPAVPPQVAPAAMRALPARVTPRRHARIPTPVHPPPPGASNWPRTRRFRRPNCTPPTSAGQMRSAARPESGLGRRFRGESGAHRGPAHAWRTRRHDRPARGRHSAQPGRAAPAGTIDRAGTRDVVGRTGAAPAGACIHQTLGCARAPVLLPTRPAVDATGRSGQP